MTEAAKQSSSRLEMAPVNKKIRVKKQNTSEADKISYAHSLTPVSSRVLAARGYKTDKNLDTYLKPTLKDGLPSPKELKNLYAGAELIAEVATAGGKIAICCDFDVDGLSSGAQLYDFLKKSGCNAKVFVPDRFEDGYGLNSKMIEEIARGEFSLMVTLDYGTTNVAELTLARERGLKTVVVDHHHVETNPPSDVFINPQQKGCNFADGVLCAAGLTWYLLIALRKVMPSAAHLDPKSFLDLACLGTICDMVPLQGVNRIIAKRGLENLSFTARPGLAALKDVIGAGKKLSCSHVSFGIGPRLNAAGRMVHGSLVIELLTTEDTKLAKQLAKKLNKLNKERQETEEAVKNEALQKASEFEKDTSALVVWGENFHTGVIGIVAQRLVEHFYRPSAVMGLKNGSYTGSVRGIKGFNVVDALSRASEHLEKFGGHEGAGGFSVSKEKLLDFRNTFMNICTEDLKSIETTPSVDADTQASLSELTPALVKELKAFEPFGMGNAGPVLVVDDLEVKEIKILKGAHLKVMLTDGRYIVPGLIWRRTEHPALQVGNKVRIACKPDLNNFRGMQELQLTLQAVECMYTRRK